MFRQNSALMSKIVSVSRTGLTGSETPVKLAAQLLNRGEVIGVPTDTIYGIAGLVQNSEAVTKIYKIKGRDPLKPIAICLSKIPDIYTYAQVNVSENLLESLLPGPVTLVFNRTQVLNKNFNPETELIGVRIPDNTFIRSVCSSCDSPLALTSANYSAGQSCLDVQEFQHLHHSLAAVFDAGPLGDTELSRLGSTVVDLSVPGEYRIIRPGSALELVESRLGEEGLTRILD
jgi:tRNA threonylcarbamoyl adenosine modification protein (Sua5/YciO/YrdC/YwlC family)